MIFTELCWIALRITPATGGKFHSYRKFSTLHASCIAYVLLLWLQGENFSLFLFLLYVPLLGLLLPRPLLTSMKTSKTLPQQPLQKANLENCSGADLNFCYRCSESKATIVWLFCFLLFLCESINQLIDIRKRKYTSLCPHTKKQIAILQKQNYIFSLDEIVLIVWVNWNIAHLRSLVLRRVLLTFGFRR